MVVYILRELRLSKQEEKEKEKDMIAISHPWRSCVGLGVD
jgi:hypothetical protein